MATITNKPGQLNFEFRKNADYRKTMKWELVDVNGNKVPVDMTGFLIAIKVYDSHLPSRNLLDTLNQSSGNVYNIDPTNGKFDLFFPKAKLSSWNKDRLFYELEITQSNNDIKILTDGYIKII